MTVNKCLTTHKSELKSVEKADFYHSGHYNHSVSYVTDLASFSNIPGDQLHQLEKVTSSYSFRATDYYLNLIDWSDPDDPIRRLIIPNEDELVEWGDYDASNEAAITPIHGVQHKYPEIALFLVTDTCASFCRYCFRKRLFTDGNKETSKNIDKGLKYISDHPEISEILITGGDPLTLPTSRLTRMLDQISEIEHVKVIRIGSKTPAFNPWRLSADLNLQESLYNFTQSGKRIYLMAHFDHPRELTDQAVREIQTYIDCGVICLNQCPIVRGINDDPDILKELYQKLHHIGCSPYYLFQGRPTKGNALYRVPIIEAYKIFSEAIKGISGLAKRARFVMSHSSGKVEVVGLDDNNIYMRYHRAKNRDNLEKFVIFKRNESAYWLDDLTPA